MFKIAISGKANSGKNTLSSCLQEALELGEEVSFPPQASVQQYAFANPMKEIVLNMFPQADREHLFGPSALRAQTIPGTNITYREALLAIGKFGRQFNENCWIDMFEKSFKQSVNIEAYFINDVRFVNEFNKLKELGFYLIRVKRNKSVKIDDISEVQQDQILDEQFDSVILNDGSLQDLKDRSKEISKVLKRI